MGLIHTLLTFACYLAASFAVDVNLLSMTAMTDAGDVESGCLSAGRVWAAEANGGKGGCTSAESERTISAGMMLAVQHCTWVLQHRDCTTVCEGGDDNRTGAATRSNPPTPHP